MTSPSAPQSNGASFTELVDTAREAPRWLVFGVVLAGGLLAYWFFSVRESETPQMSWRDRAVELLVERGYYRPNAERAVNSYLNGGHMTAEDVALITIVLRALGQPPKNEKAAQPSSPTTEYPGDPIDIPNDEPNYDLPSGVLPGEYWYVPVAPAGWSSTFNGISLQFYGTTSHAALIQQVNPGLQSTTYGKLPVGATVKVPRT
jgi:hypothetical protein